MTLEYEQSLDDLLIFNESVYLKSAASEKAMRLGRRIIVSFTMLPALLADWGLGLFPWFTSFGVAWCVFALYRYPARRLRIFRKQLRQYLEELYQKDQGHIGMHSVTLTDDALVGKCATSESRHFYKGVTIKEYEGYTYVFVNATMAFILSPKQIRSGDLSVFLTELKKKLESLTMSQEGN